MTYGARHFAFISAVVGSILCLIFGSAAEIFAGSSLPSFVPIVFVGLIFLVIFEDDLTFMSSTLADLFTVIIGVLILVNGVMLIG